MINAVTLVGRLTRDPELRYAGTGTAVCNFNLAVNRNFKTQDGQEADFINCVVFKGGAESLANYQRKGNLLGVTGRMQSGSYEKDGRTIYTTEVIADSVQFLDPKDKSKEDKPASETDGQASNDSYGKSEAEPIDISDSDLPF